MAPFKMRKNVSVKILIWHMAGEISKKRAGQGFLSCNYFCGEINMLFGENVIS